jgi:phi13 family phage major tail protein
MSDTNKVKFGLKNCYYAKATIGTDGSATYATAKPLVGAVSLSMTPQGDRTPFYADNIEYYVSQANNGYEGSLELAKIPEDFLKDCLGQNVGGNGILYESVQDQLAHFALLFQFEGDKTAKRHVFYNCVASRPETSGETISETKEPQTETVDLSASSVYVSALSKDVVKGSVNEGDTPYSSWFSSVVLPTATT